MSNLNLIERFLNLLFREHKRCFVCGGIADYSAENIDYICNSCFLEIETNFYDNCSKCGKSIDTVYSGIYKCTDCNSREYSFEKAYSPLRYEGKIQEIITGFKYHDKAYYKKFLGEFMVYKAYEQSLDSLDVIIPVPMEDRKKRVRGYNQAELLSDYVSEKLGIEVKADVLIRKKESDSQKGLNRLQREMNLKNAFSVKSNCCRGKNILLIDDVYTTGSTVDNCSRALKKQGAKAVYILTAASTPCKE